MPIGGMCGCAGGCWGGPGGPTLRFGLGKDDEDDFGDVDNGAEAVTDAGGGGGLLLGDLEVVSHMRELMSKALLGSLGVVLCRSAAACCCSASAWWAAAAAARR